MSLSEKIRTVVSALVNLIDTCTEEELHYKPTADSWSILECVEHIYLVNRNVFIALQTPPPLSHENKLSELHSEGKLNHILVTKREIKRTAPPLVVPKGIFKTKVEAKEAIRKSEAEILNALKATDISKETHTIAHPSIGEMTKTDWVHFSISHTQRHLFQIEEIKNAYKNRMK